MKLAKLVSTAGKCVQSRFMGFRRPRGYSAGKTTQKGSELVNRLEEECLKGRMVQPISFQHVLYLIINFTN